MRDIRAIRRQNLQQLADRVGSQAAIAAAIERDRNQIYQWLLPEENPASRGLGTASARRIEAAFGLEDGWLDRDQSRLGAPADIAKALSAMERDEAMFGRATATPTRYLVRPATDETPALPVRLVDALGSCGGGVLHEDLESRPPLLKEPRWFQRYGVRPDDTLAVWADGDSMADFIIDGDIVIFDTSKRTPRSGHIFLLEHPEGLRIKRLRQQFDRSWVLESNNPDKRRFPDEVITADQAEHMRIVGQFVYRQGG